jgi:hypothetical protein
MYEISDYTNNVLLDIFFIEIYSFLIRGRIGRDRMVVGFTTTYVITTDVVSLNLDQGEVYNIM